MIRVILSLLFFTASTAVIAYDGKSEKLNVATIERTTHLEGHWNYKTDVFKISLPRNDLNVIINGVKLTSGMGLTSWAIFKKMPSDVKMKADLVVTENQVNTILSTALENHLSVTALHNHLLWESPAVLFLHVEGDGTEKSLALALRNVFTKIKETSDDKGDFPLAEIDTADTDLSLKKIDNILETKGTMQDGVYKVFLSRLAKSDDPYIAKNFGISTTATFAGSNNASVVQGNLAMQTKDLQKVLKPLHKAGIVIVALHQQINRDPQAIFVHYFGVGQVNVLAKGLRAAINSADLNVPELITDNRHNVIFPMPACWTSMPFTPIASEPRLPLTNNKQTIANNDASELQPSTQG